MVIKNRILKFSSLCLVGAITIAVNQFVPSDSGSHTADYSTRSTNNAMVNNISEADASEESKTISGSTIMSGSGTVDNSTPAAATVTPVPTATPDPTTAIIDKLKDPVGGVDYAKLVNEAQKRYPNFAYANVANYLNVRAKASTSSAVVGKMPDQSCCNIIKTVKGDDGQAWYQIKSGDISGYVTAEYLITGEDAKAKFGELGRLVVVVDCDVLNVRVSPSTNAKIMYKIAKGEELEIEEIKDDWVQVSAGIDTDSAYVATSFVNITFDFVKAYSDDEATIVGYSTTRAALVAEARKHIGGKYRYGGTSYSTGIDCSAFMQAVYKKVCNISLERSSRDQASSNGRKISESQLQPGDLVFYSNGSHVKHVAMFIGNGKIIHASNPRGGIKISNMKYTTPYMYKNVLNDLK